MTLYSSSYMTFVPSENFAVLLLLL